MAEPAMGETCMPAQGTCMVGTRICDCITPGNTWACWSPTDCPTAVPPEQSSCPVVGMTCSPTRGASCRCTANGWDCGNQYCPPAEPALGTMCEGGDGACTYGARTCDCTNNAWVCWGAADCPNPPPADNSMCPLSGVNCMYEGGSCQCSGSRGWRCGRGVMNDPMDAGL
ncbi:MAG TPA: hypothetical protein VJR89_15105 [Polyangiales bacterium]|nr:hypothetical protein [Polyangiales bacterium]